MTAPPSSGPILTVRYRVTGMDCASCAGKIETAARAVPGVSDIKVSTASQVMTLTLETGASRLPDVEAAVEALGYHLDRLDASGASTDAGDEGVPRGLSHVTSAYRRALWIVVLLNLGYGSVEAVAGFVADSQALKADSLDFVGDGLITLLGLAAVGWGLVWRARAALIEGIFLGALGLGVLGTTAYRIFVENEPEAQVMGVFGAVALAVNLSAALVLIPHRAGDANVRAVWLFSRNDAIGNAIVVAAAGLVAWTATPWPDLVAAVLIAGLFIHSSWSIVRDARSDLRGASERPPV